MKNKYDAVIFDLDGTLIDSMWVWEDVDDQFLKENNLTLHENLETHLEGKGFTETAEFFKEYFNLEHSVEDIKIRWNDIASVNYREKVVLKEDVIEFLEYLKSKGMKMGIATSNSRVLVEIILKKFEIDKYFSSVKISCDVEKGKPFPFVYQAVASELGVECSRCLVFEDVVNGVLAGKRAGMTVWGIEDRQSEESKQRVKEVADNWVNDYKEAISYLEAIKLK